MPPPSWTASLGIRWPDSKAFCRVPLDPLGKDSEPQPLIYIHTHAQDNFNVRMQREKELQAKVAAKKAAKEQK